MATFHEHGWCYDMDDAPRDRRIIVWLPGRTGKNPRAAYAIWNPDRYARRPRPFWDIEGNGRITASRENQPVAWRHDVEGADPALYEGRA